LSATIQDDDATSQRSRSPRSQDMPDQSGARQPRFKIAAEQKSKKESASTLTVPNVFQNTQGDDLTDLFESEETFNMRKVLSNENSTGSMGFQKMMKGISKNENEESKNSASASNSGAKKTEATGPTTFANIGNNRRRQANQTVVSNSQEEESSLDLLASDATLPSTLPSTLSTEEEPKGPRQLRDIIAQKKNKNAPAVEETKSAEKKKVRGTRGTKQSESEDASQSTEMEIENKNKATQNASQPEEEEDLPRRRTTRRQAAASQKTQEEEEEEEDKNETKLENKRRTRGRNNRIEEEEEEEEEEKTNTTVTTAPKTRGRPKRNAEQPSLESIETDATTQKKVKGDASQQSEADETQGTGKKVVTRRGAKKETEMEIEAPKRNAYQVMFSGFEKGDSELEELKKSLTNLGVKTVEEKDKNFNVLVMNSKFKRTIKFLLALSKGIDVVSHKWVKECVSNNKVLPPSNYTFTDKEAEKKYDFKVAKILEVTKQKSENGFLEGYRVYIPANITPSFEEVKLIIESASGSVVKTKPTSFKADILVVLNEDDDKNIKAFKNTKYKPYSTELIFSGVLQQKLNLNKSQL